MSMWIYDCPVCGFRKMDCPPIGLYDKDRIRRIATCDGCVGVFTLREAIEDLLCPQKKDGEDNPTVLQ